MNRRLRNEVAFMMARHCAALLVNVLDVTVQPTISSLGARTPLR